MNYDKLAMLFLLLVIGSPITLAIVALFRKPYSPIQWFLFFVNTLLVRILWRAEVPKSLPIPADCGAVVICNHRSSLDPCFIQYVSDRRLVHWMVAQLYAPKSFIARVLKQLGVIPVRKRGSDASPTIAAIKMAAAGELVGLLPEGTINTTEEFMRPVRPGAILVALKARVPILPCYIEGAPYHDIPWMPVFMPTRARLKTGALIDLSEYYGRENDRELVGQLTIRCVKEIAKLAGNDDFEPRLAGRDWKTWQ